MNKEILYVYLGTNGTICSPVFLEGIYHIKKYRLRADDKKVLTKDDKTYVKSVIVPINEIDTWKEINDPNLGQI